jgi:hypothetical protein
LLAADYSCPISGILHEETFGIDRELYPAVGVLLPYEAYGSLNALGLNRHIEAGSSTAYLDRNIHHLRSALFLLPGSDEWHQRPRAVCCNKY